MRTAILLWLNKHFVPLVIFGWLKCWWIFVNYLIFIQLWTSMKVKPIGEEKKHELLHVIKVNRCKCFTHHHLMEWLDKDMHVFFFSSMLNLLTAWIKITWATDVLLVFIELSHYFECNRIFTSCEKCSQSWIDIVEEFWYHKCEHSYIENRNKNIPFKSHIIL